MPILFTALIYSGPPEKNDLRKFDNISGSYVKDAETYKKALQFAIEATVMFDFEAEYLGSVNDGLNTTNTDTKGWAARFIVDEEREYLPKYMITVRIFLYQST